MNSFCNFVMKIIFSIADIIYKCPFSMVLFYASLSSYPLPVVQMCLELTIKSSTKVKAQQFG